MTAVYLAVCAPVNASRRSYAVVSGKMVNVFRECLQRATNKRFRVGQGELQKQQS